MRTVTTRFIRVLDRGVNTDASAWAVARRDAWIGLIVPLVAMAGLVATLAVRPVFEWLTAEDSLTEWLQVLALVAASIAYLRLALVLHRRARRALALLCVGIAAGAFFVAGEEISWGQRLFGLALPEALAELNKQDEINVHNIAPVQRLFWLGELAAGLYGAAVPIAVAMGFAKRLRDFPGYVIAPPLFLASAFFLPFAYRAVRLFILPESGFVVTKLGELPELTLYAAIAVTGIVCARRAARELGREPVPAPMLR